jgi:bifunctional non-homologous end joining protein LigD
LGVAKGVTLDPRVEREAIETDDHHLGHLTFEGTRRAKLYGAGEVCIWDRGNYEAADCALEDWFKGKLYFSLFGEKLRGLFKIEKCENHPKEWSLFKMTDKFADPDFKLIHILTPRKDPKLPLFSY